MSRKLEIVNPHRALELSRLEGHSVIAKTLPKQDGAPTEVDVVDPNGNVYRCSTDIPEVFPSP